jgi:hypothetical protein
VATLEILNLVDQEHVAALHWGVMCQQHENCLRLLKVPDTLLVLLWVVFV